MPRKTRNRKDEMDGGESSELPDDSQAEMFPELDKDKPKEMALRKALKKWRAAKSEHAEFIANSHEKMEDAKAQAVGLMHECDIEKCQVDGEIYERSPGPEKLHVKKAKVQREDEEEDAAE